MDDVFKSPRSRMTYEISSDEDGLVKLVVHHESDVPDSALIAGVSKGRALIPSNLKSFLETGELLPGAEDPHHTCAGSKA